MKGDEEEDDVSIMNSSDEEEEIEEKEAPFEPSAEQTNLHIYIDSPNTYLHRHQEKVAIELAYILFTCYREQMREIGVKNGCSIKIAMNLYMVGCKEEGAKARFDKCCQEVKQFVNSVVYYVHKEMNLKDKTKIFQSQFFQQKCTQKDIQMIKFNKQLYFVSNKLSQKDIKTRITNIAQSKFIFTVFLCRHKCVNAAINRAMAKFVQTMIEFQSNEFKEKEIIVELNRSKTSIYIIGSRESNVMFGKNWARNLVESTIAFIMRNYSLSGKQKNQLIEYCKSVSPKYPLLCIPTHEHYLAFISKDNIIRGFLQKSQPGFQNKNIEKVQKFNQRMGIKENTDFGIYFFNSVSIANKKMTMLQTAKEKGYDSYRVEYMRFFRKLFIKQGAKVQKQDDLAAILTMIDKISNVKQRYANLPQKTIEPIQPSALESSQNDYLITGTKTRDEAISKQLKRDVQSQKVTMKRKLTIGYNVFQGVEREAFWKMGEEGKTEVKTQQMKAGQYFRGRVKASQENPDKTAYILDYLLTVF